jgi:anti-sigma regulatory factor (Ser/Thr protein kinase)
MLDERSHQAPYCDRVVDVFVHLSTRLVRCVLQHDGQGVDRKVWTEPADSGELEGGRARGWLLVKSFMDEVTFNAAGTEVVLVRRFA